MSDAVALPHVFGGGLWEARWRCHICCTGEAQVSRRGRCVWFEGEFPSAAAVFVVCVWNNLRGAVISVSVLGVRVVVDVLTRVSRCHRSGRVDCVASKETPSPLLFIRVADWLVIDAHLLGAW